MTGWNCECCAVPVCTRFPPLKSLQISPGLNAWDGDKTVQPLEYSSNNAALEYSSNNAEGHLLEVASSMPTTGPGHQIFSLSSLRKQRLTMYRYLWRHAMCLSMTMDGGHIALSILRASLSWQDMRQGTFVISDKSVHETPNMYSGNQGYPCVACYLWFHAVCPGITMGRRFEFEKLSDSTFQLSKLSSWAFAVFRLPYRATSCEQQQRR